MAADNEARLRREIESLRREVEEQKRQLQERSSPHVVLGEGRPPHPSRSALWLIAAAAALVVVAAFFAGYIPRQRRVEAIAAEALSHQQAEASVSVVSARRAPVASELELPGNIQAVTEAPILARADGYIRKRSADIGDRVKEGQLLAEIEAPELDNQVRQARASLQQVQAAAEQASANFAQGKTNTELARVTAARWGNLAAKGAVSRQENDQYQAQYQAQLANLDALTKAIAAARSNVAAAQASLARLEDMQSYKMVKAPFAGVITLRNIDTGALITAGSTLLYRIAQTGTLRTYLNVPQGESPSVRAGQTARISIPDIPGRLFSGVVTRTASALDPSSRTLLTEVQVPNADGALLPGMYAIVDLSSPRRNPPLVIPGDALVVRADGTQVAAVGADNVVHYRRIDVGRDYGDKVEVLGGLAEGDRVVVNPGDTAREGARVKAIPLAEKPSRAPQRPPAQSGK